MNSFLITFLLTWVMLLSPPLALRAFLGRPLQQVTSTKVSILYCLAWIGILAAIEGGKPVPPAVVFGAIACYYILKWKPKSSQQEAIGENGGGE